MGWLFYILVQVLIMMGFLTLAIHTAPSVFSFVYLLGSVLFFYRSINHPDFWLRRGFLICLTLGSTHLTLGNISQLDTAVFSPFWQSLIEILKVILLPGPCIGFGLLGFAVVFAILELIRMHIDAAKKFDDRAFVQISDISEEFFEDRMIHQIKIEANIQNPNSSEITLTQGEVTRFGVFPVTQSANVDSLAGHVVMPENKAIKIDPGSSISVIATAYFSMMPYTFRKLRFCIQKSCLYQRVFVFRSLSFRTRSTSGFKVLAKDSSRRKF